jgi:uncharacterized membrane protein
MLPNGFYLSTMWEWMAWNTFLACIPYVLSLYLFRPKQELRLLWSLGFIVFVLFMPNAPYVITDVMHLFFNETTRQSDPTLTIFIFLLFELVGIALFLKSYQRFERFTLTKIKATKIVIRLISFLVISFGVYLGRFQRLNSWDVFYPNRIIASVEELQIGHMVGYTLLFTALLWLIYFLYERLKTN